MLTVLPLTNAGTRLIKLMMADHPNQLSGQKSSVPASQRLVVEKKPYS